MKAKRKISPRKIRNEVIITILIGCAVGVVTAMVIMGTYIGRAPHH